MDTVSGAVGANRINRLKLEKVAVDTKKPILALGAYHAKPDTVEGRKMKPSEFDADDFRGMENEILLCEGARVLLTQNLWVEAGLMNGALGFVRGYMWPPGGDPHSDVKELRAPHIVFVEFDSVNLGVDESGRPRSFFPNDPVRKNWVPIYHQEISSTVVEGVKRANFPLTLAWALTHWKAQGMTLDKVRVHLSNRTAGVPGIGFVACTRVRHPWDLVFEEDLPEYEHFMKGLRTEAFRERKRFELRTEARASRTLRKYGYCEADLWTGEESRMAAQLLDGLVVAREEQKRRLTNTLFVDSDTWLWGDSSPDFVGDLGKQVMDLAAGDEVRRRAFERVADRLLDRTRVRKASSDECIIANALLNNDAPVSLSGLTLEGMLQEKASRLFADYDEENRETVRRVVARLVVNNGIWDEKVEDVVPLEMQPLHMSAVREALGALIPERLHKRHDKAAAKAKVDYGGVRGGINLLMHGWRLNVRAEDALARGRLEEEALEFFLLVLKQICKRLKLPIEIGSKTVGKEVGRQENVAGLARVRARWQQVWSSEHVRAKETLILPVALDDKNLPQDWVCVLVRSAVSGQCLGEARRLRVEVYDSAKRSTVAKRVVRNIDALLRGVGAHVDTTELEIKFLDVPACHMRSQRILCCFGLVLQHVGLAAKEQVLDVKSEAFVPNVGLVLRALFARFRKELGEGGVADIELSLIHI